jgi:hypothetical protein
MPTRNELAVLAGLKAKFKERIPSGKVIALLAIRNALPANRRSPKWVKAHFSELIEGVQVDAYKLYLDAEKPAWKSAFVKVFGPLLRDCSDPEKTALVIYRHFYALDKFFLGLTNGRRARAGSAFEILLRELFTLLKYPFTPHPKIDGNPDFVLPSVDHYKQNPLDSIVFTAKRSLRERWRQITSEGEKGTAFFLATIDEYVSEKDLRTMQTKRIFLVVPARLKKSIDHYRLAPAVITFEEFFRSHLDPAMARWKRNVASNSSK